MGGMPKLNFNVKPVHIFKYIDIECTILDVGYTKTPFTSGWLSDVEGNQHIPCAYYNGFIIKFQDYPAWKMITRWTHLWGEESYAYRFVDVTRCMYNRVQANPRNFASFLNMTTDNRLPVEEDERFDYVKTSLRAAKTMHIEQDSFYKLHILCSFPTHVNVDGEDKFIHSSTCFTTEPNDRLEVLR